MTTEDARPGLDGADATLPTRRSRRWLSHAIPWAITIACFAYLYTRVDAAAGPERSAFGYLASIFASVSWTQWLLLMIPYSVLFLLIDTLVLWRVVNWFNAPIAYRELLPVRASAYIISIVNEQVGKGAIALFLNRRHGVPGWQVGSSMLFIMFCEFYYLLTWALVGCLLTWEKLPDVFHVIPVVWILAALFFVGFLAVFRSERFRGLRFRDRQLLHAFRQARPSHYLTVIALRSPALLAAVFVYSQAAALFGVDIPFVDMLGFLPVIFFGTLVPGPFRAVAVTMWPTLFPAHAGQLTAFGFVQHNFFVLFNAAIGLVFLRRVNREIALAAAPPAPVAERAAEG